MATPAAVLLPADEYLIRPLVCAWLGYPSHPAKRKRAIVLMQQWARNRIGQPLSGRSDITAKARIDSGLSQLARMVDRQLLAGEVFRRQLLASLPNDPGIFGNTSDTNFARRLARHQQGVRGPLNDHVNYGSQHRSYWRDRLPCLALAVGTCDGLASRPPLADLLFTERPWALRAITIAERTRHLALVQAHRAATAQVEFRLVDR